MDAMGIKLKGPEVMKLIKGNFAYEMIREIGNPITIGKNIKLFDLLKAFFVQLKRPRAEKKKSQTKYLADVCYSVNYVSLSHFE